MNVMSSVISGTFYILRPPGPDKVRQHIRRGIHKFPVRDVLLSASLTGTKVKRTSSKSKVSNRSCRGLTRHQGEQWIHRKVFKKSRRHTCYQSHPKESVLWRVNLTVVFPNTTAPWPVTPLLLKDVFKCCFPSCMHRTTFSIVVIVLKNLPPYNFSLGSYIIQSHCLDWQKPNVIFFFFKL